MTHSVISKIKHKLHRAFWMLVVVMMAFSNTNAQDVNKKILAEIGHEKLTVEEFLQIYRKNNVQAADLDPKSLEEYLELYINFRLKVLEAEEYGLHQEASFKEEFDGYRAQLAKPYLVDEEATERLVKEAHQRLQEDLRASHLLIRVEKNAAPADTLAAYNKIMGLRDIIMKGEKFADIAHESSEDQSARDREAQGRTMRGNKGDLGYFTAFDMVYAFESAAYAIQKDEVSMPVRTDFGYHLIYLTDRKPAMGQASAAHILLLYPPEPGAKDSLELKEKIDMIYGKLQAGEAFEDLARQYSDDRSTAEQGGLLQTFGSNRMIPEFIYEISKITEPGQYSKPFSSHFGWHIIKLYDLKKPPAFEEAYEELKERVQRNERSVVIEKSLVNKIKNEYGFKESAKALEVFNNIVTDSIFSGTWEIPSRPRLRSELFSIGSETYTQQDFANYLFENQRRKNPENIPYHVSEIYKQFVEGKLIAYEDRQLENKYPEFRALVREYRDGILLFELTDQKIWSMAVQDTAGLAAYHEANKYNYMWGKRADASIFTFVNDGQQLVEKALKMVKENAPNEEILETVNKDGLVLNISRRLYQEGDNELVDAVEWNPGPKEPVEKDDKTTFVVIHDIREPAPRQLNEVRGMVTADYQNHLEKEWIRELRNKYPVKVNRDLLSQIR
jgi:peptidyl-prolyl cis-trans isomerase SurA